MSGMDKVWDRFAKGYAKRPVSDEGAYQKKLQVTREYLKPDMEVLEIGCGTGSTAIVHVPNVKYILAVDFSTKMLAIARDKAAAANIDNITFERSGIEDLEVPDQTFDMVMGHSILHLLKDKEGVISKVHAMLKPGGVFVSSTICMGARLHLLRIVLPLGRILGLLPLVRFFSVEDLVQALVGAGFKIDHQWRPSEKNAVFIVARKAG